MGKGGSISGNEDEILESFGPSLGTFHGLHSCAYLLGDGHLCIGSKSVGFRSTEFDNERKIMIALTDVSSINDINSSDLCIKTVLGEDYVFKGFESRDDVVQSLNGVKERAHTELSDVGEISSKQELKMQRRRSSFPNIPVHALPEGDIDNDDIDIGLKALRDMTTAIDLQKETYEAELEEIDEKEPIQDASVRTRTESMAFFSIACKSRDPKDIGNAWAQLKSEKNKSYPSPVIDNVRLPYNSDEFYKNFWSNGAPHPREKYMIETQDDEEIKTTNWKDTGDGFTLGRVYDYLHPNNAPMGPPKAPSKTEQTLQKYDSHGIQICSSTTVSDVPMSDAFVVEDRVLLDQTDDGLIMRVDMGVRFVKMCMFKTIISTAAKSATYKSWTDYIDYIKSRPDYPGESEEGS